eukprot:92938_1
MILVSAFLFPENKWDFRLEWVKSINMSGHKYGLAYPGIGWVLFKTFEDIHKGLVFSVDYLGAPEITFTLNFSKGANNVLSQYYQFNRLGKSGYTTVFKECMINAAILEKALADWENADGSKMFKIFSKVCSKTEDGEPIPTLPCVVFSMHPGACEFNEVDLVTKLSTRGWILPACVLPLPDEEPSVTVIRIVVRETLSENLTHILLWDIHRSMTMLSEEFKGRPKAPTLQRLGSVTGIMPTIARRASVIC